MFKHTKTGMIFDNRKDAIIAMGTSRYRRALKNMEFEFNYTLKEGEYSVKIEYKED